MNAEFFALAFTAALNPKLLAIDLLLIENRRPRAMFLCVLLGGLTVGITVGLLDVLTVHADAMSTQDARRQRRSRPGPGPAAAGHRRAAGHRPPARPATDTSSSRHRATGADGEERRLDGAGLGRAAAWAGHAGGALCGLPGATYLTALHNLITGNYSTATQVVAVIVFVLIEFLLIIIPLSVFLDRPEAHQGRPLNRTPRSRSGCGASTLQRDRASPWSWAAYLTVSALVHLT